MSNIKKILENKNTYLIILIILLVIMAFDFIRMLSFDDQIRLWPFIAGHSASIIFIFLLVIQMARLEKISQVSKLPNSQLLPKYSSSNAIVSFICSLIPLPFLIYCLIINYSPLVGFLFAAYFITIGIPASFLWLVCGIIGLKTGKRKLALASLILRPVGILVIVALSAILNH